MFSNEVIAIIDFFELKKTSSENVYFLNYLDFNG